MLRNSKCLGASPILPHGDRSGIHELPGASQAHWSCALSNGSAQAMEHAELNFQVRDISSARILERSMYPEIESMYSGDEKWCKPGQLTDQGMSQHRSLGGQLHLLYKDFIEEHLTSPEKVFIRSTDYPRTLQSAASFLSTFLPEKLTSLLSAADKKINIWTTEDFNSEIMHGVGIKHESTRYSDKVLAQAWQCDEAIALANKQRQYFENTTMLSGKSMIMHQLESFFGNDIRSMKITDATDPIHARICHRLPLPCSPKGCVDPTMASDMISKSHAMYCGRYSGAQGGERATKLAMKPFLDKLLDDIMGALEGEAGPSVPLYGEGGRAQDNWRRNGEGAPFSLYVGHDTVVSPVLAALGAFDCLWPPYAAHIVLEIWKDNDLHHHIRTAKTPSQVGTIHQYLDAFSFRLFYNGADRTRHVTGCPQSGGSRRGGGGLACPFKVLHGLISGVVAPYESLEEACQPRMGAVVGG